MVARGRVRNGVVVLDAGLHLPEGHEVTVLARGADPGLRWLAGAEPERGAGAHEIGAGDALSNTSGPSHSLLDILTVSLGPLPRLFAPDDDLLTP